MVLYLAWAAMVNRHFYCSQSVDQRTRLPDWPGGVMFSLTGTQTVTQSAPDGWRLSTRYEAGTHYWHDFVDGWSEIVWESLSYNALWTHRTGRNFHRITKPLTVPQLQLKMPAIRAVRRRLWKSLRETCLGCDFYMSVHLTQIWWPRDPASVWKLLQIPGISL